MKKFLIGLLLFSFIIPTPVECGRGGGVAAGIAAGVFTGLATSAIANSSRRSDKTERLQREHDNEKLAQLRRDMERKDINRYSIVTNFLFLLVVLLAFAVLGLGYIVMKRRR